MLQKDSVRQHKTAVHNKIREAEWSNSSYFWKMAIRSIGHNNLGFAAPSPWAYSRPRSLYRLRKPRIMFREAVAHSEENRKIEELLIG